MREINLQQEIERLTVDIADSSEISDMLHNPGWMLLQAKLEIARQRCWETLEKDNNPDSTATARSLARGITALLGLVNGEALRRESALNRKAEFEAAAEHELAMKLTGLHDAPDGL